jgi:hypothetical protein
MQVYRSVLLSLVLSNFAVTIHAQDYPDMVGLWTGQVRIVQSRAVEEDRLEIGGVVISEIELELTIDAQDQETFIGRTRSSQSPANSPPTHVWGSIRSTGTEALFITSTGGRGQLWFSSESSFEYCYNAINESGSIVSYCAVLTKQ